MARLQPTKLNKEGKNWIYEQNTKPVKPINLKESPWINLPEHYTKEDWDNLNKKE